MSGVPERPPIGFELIAGHGNPPINTPDYGYPPEPVSSTNYNIQMPVPMSSDLYPPLRQNEPYNEPVIPGTPVQAAQFSHVPVGPPEGSPTTIGFGSATSSNMERPPSSGRTSNDQVSISQPTIGFVGVPSESKSSQPTHSSTIRSPSSRSQTPLKEDFREVQEIDKEDTNFFRDGVRRIEKGSEKEEKRAGKRKEFERNLKRKGLHLELEDVEEASDGKTFYIKLHAPWHVLCRMAEEMLMKMPIATNDLDIRTFKDKISELCCCRNPFELQEEDIEEEPNYFTGAFRQDRVDKYIMPPEGKELFFTNAQRSRIVHRLLMTTRYGDERRHQTGISRLIRNGSYTAAFPLHEGNHTMKYSLLTHKPSSDRQLLYYHWARPGRWFKEQPLDLIRKYFGEKVGIYFTWLGYYTTMLFPAALLGLVAVIYGLATMSSNIAVQEICDSNSTSFPMCPRCDEKCPYWSLKDSCTYAKVAYVLDNPATVIFAVFMSFWATCFLEFWKRKQADISYQWDLVGFEDEEEQPRPEYEALLTTTRINPVTQIEEPHMPLYRQVPRYFTAFSVLLCMITLVIIAVLAVVTYRVAVSATLSKRENIESASISLFASFTAALINLTVIMILNKLYERIAWYLTSWEMPRTQTNFDDIYTFKMYIFQFVNFYASLFYIAFFKLDPGRPAKYNKVFGFRREECNPAGCLFELGVQLMVIMVGKQLWNNIVEIVVPKLLNWWRSRDLLPDQEEHKLTRWEKDYDLVDIPAQGLFYEYLEMVIQFGFITLFVAAFPLGPFFAFWNNMVEIRVDAYKYVAVFRRPMAARAQDIGIWFPILHGIAKLSVVVNAFVIGFVSEFVPRLYYQIAISPDGSLKGFLNYTLSCFDIMDFDDDDKPDASTLSSFVNGSCGFSKPSCRFRGFYQDPYIMIANQMIRNPNAYAFKADHWHIVAAKLFFVVAFEHVVIFVTGVIAWLIPDVPTVLDNQIKRENYLAREIRAEEAAMKDAENDADTSPLNTL